MADIVNSLFGIDPAALQQQRAAIDSANAFRYAQLDPLEQAKMSIYQGSAGLGRGIQQLLGGDEQLNRATKVRQLASRFDITSPNGLRQFAEAVSPFAPDVAQQAIKRSDEIITKGLQQGKLVSETGKLDTETRLYGREIKEIGVPDNPELVQKAVVDKEGNIISRVGQPYSRFSQKTTNITNLPAGETEFVKKLGKNDADTVTETMKTRATSLETIKSLEQLRSLSNQELITGTLATGRVGAANLLATLGLASKADVTRISTSQQYDKVAKDVIFQTLGGKLGAGFSNEDRRFIEALIPQLETSPDARRQLISYMIDKNTLIVNEATRLENYGREKNSLKGFDYKIPRESLAPINIATKPQFTREQLEAELKRKLEEGKK